MCEVFYDDCEPVKFWNVVYPKARKHHVCATCLIDILPGQNYAKYSWASSGTAVSEKQCLACHKAAVSFNESHRWHPFPSSLLETMIDCIDEGDEDSTRWKVEVDRIRWMRAEISERATV